MPVEWITAHEATKKCSPKTTGPNFADIFLNKMFVSSTRIEWQKIYFVSVFLYHVFEIIQRIFLLLLQKHDETLPKIFRPIHLEKEDHRQKRHGQVRSLLQCAAIMSKKKKHVDDPCVNKGDCEQNLK